MTFLSPSCSKFFFFRFSFCRFRRLATMAAISRWSSNSASPSPRRRRSRDRSNAYSSHMGRSTSWVASLSGCACRRRRTCTRTLGVAWRRQLRTRKANGESSSSGNRTHLEKGNQGFSKCHQHSIPTRRFRAVITRLRCGEQ